MRAKWAMPSIEPFVVSGIIRSIPCSFLFRIEMSAALPRIACFSYGNLLINVFPLFFLFLSSLTAWKAIEGCQVSCWHVATWKWYLEGNQLHRFYQLLLLLLIGFFILHLFEFWKRNFWCFLDVTSFSPELTVLVWDFFDNISKSMLTWRSNSLGPFRPCKTKSRSWRKRIRLYVFTWSLIFCHCYREKFLGSWFDHF